MSDPHLLLSGYVLDALDPDDRALFVRHLAQCEDCRRELAELGPTVGQLSALTATTPPPELRDRVLSEISRVRQVDPAPFTDVAGRHGGDATMPETATDANLDALSEPEATDESTPRRRAVHPRRITRTAITLVAVLAVVAAAAVGAWSYGRRLLTQSYDADGAAVARIIGAPDAHTYSQQGPNGMRITYVVSEQRNAALAVVEHSSTPTNDRTYQLWTVRMRQHSREFVPDQTFTNPSRPIILSTDIRSADALGITIEPAGGSLRPTTQPFAVQPI